NESDRHADVSIDGSCCLPTRRVTEQADESAVVPATIADVIHLPEQAQWDARGICDAALQNGPHDDEIPQPHNRLADDGNPSSRDDHPSEGRAARHAPAFGIVVRIDGYDTRHTDIAASSNDQRNRAADGDAAQRHRLQIEGIEKTLDRADKEIRIIPRFRNV